MKRLWLGIVPFASGIRRAVSGACLSEPVTELYGLPVGGNLSHGAQSFDIIHPADLERHRTLAETALATGGSWHSEFRVIRPRDRAVVWLEERAQVVPDPATDAMHVAGIIWDITERREAEEALRDSEARYRDPCQEMEQSAAERTLSLRRTIDQQNPVARRTLDHEAQLRSILETVPSAMVVIDAAGFIRSFSRTAEAMFGYDSEEAIGRSVGFLMPTPDRNEHDGYIARYLSTGEQHIIGRTRPVLGLRKSGQTFPLELHVGESELHGERIFTGFLNDLSEKERIEAELRQTQKMEALGKLTGGAAHDFNNLLTVILGNLELLEASAEAHQTVLISEAQAAANLAAQLTSGLLAFARKTPLNPALLDVGRLVGTTSDLLRRTLDHAIRLETSVRGRCEAIVDGTHLQNTLFNLSINARDAMPDGGTLRIDAKVQQLCPQDHFAPGCRPGAYIVIEVTDDGVGMSRDVLERAMDPFFTTKPVGSGTGLGLSAAYGFARQSGGWMMLESELGHGTTARLCLPSALPTTEAVPAISTAPRAHATSRKELRTILLVEDDPGVRKIASRRLRDIGHIVYEADNGPAALALLPTMPDIDLLFTDIMMPGGLSGVELAREIQDVRPHLPVLFSSGFAEAEDLRHAHAPNRFWLAKPYSAADLALKLDAIFRTQ